ncbi:MAG: LPS assembly protein LptD [Steroidobacteraceae bacterium]|nr:LPS assembly protein LptD [Steroidobacteraceae bacterium]
MFSRRIIASLASACLLAPAAAEECLWPAAGALAPGVADELATGDADERPIQVTSGAAEVSRDGDAHLTGGVTVRQGDRTLRSESATYDASEQRFEVEGGVEFQAPGLRLKGTSGSWRSSGGGRFTGTEFELPLRPARGSASELEMTATGDLALREVRFTTCPAGNGDWFLRASSIDIDQRAQQGRGRDVRVTLKGVPILYAPVISFPVGDARKSGFLFPSFGNSDKGGFEIGVPYYLNLAPNYDLQLKPFLLSRRGAGLDSQFRYLTQRSRGEIGNRFLPSDNVASRDRRFTALEHRTDFTDRLRFDADFADASDGLYFEDFGLGPDGTSITYLDRFLRLSWLGQGWRVDGRVQEFQTIDRTLDPATRPYARLPQIAFTGHWPLGTGGWSAALDSEAVWFERDVGVTGLRLDFAPRLAWTLRGPGWHLEPSAAWRMTGYSLSGTAPGEDDTPDREAPVLSLDAGLVFEREAGRPGGMMQTLEPRLRYTWIPYRDQSGLPVFDTALPDLNLVQLFRTNRYVGADRLGDANELAVGLTTRFVHDDTGQQFLTATIGQRFFFEPPEVTLPGELPAAKDSSNMVGEIELTGWRHWSARLAMEWDDNESNTVLGQAGVQYRPRPDSVVNLGYRYREGRLEQWDASAAWRLSPRWQVFARQVYSVKESSSIDRFAGLEYGSCCWRLRLVARRYISNRTGEEDTSVMLELELKGLSSVGTRDDTFLQRSIRGYSPGSAALP